MNRAMLDMFMRAENVPGGLKTAVKELNAKTSQWGEQGSVKKSFAESEVKRLKTQIYEMARRYYEQQAAELRQRKADTEAKWRQNKTTWSSYTQQERDEAEFAARMMGKQELQQVLAQIAGASDPGDAVAGLTAERARAVMLEGKSRGEKTADQAFRNMERHGLSLAAFDHPELCYLENMAAEYEQTPPNIIRVQHETRGEDMPVEIDQLIDIESLDSLAG